MMIHNYHSHDQIRLPDTNQAILFPHPGPMYFWLAKSEQSPGTASSSRLLGTFLGCKFSF